MARGRPKKERRVIARLIAKELSWDRDFWLHCDRSAALAYILLGSTTAPGEVIPLTPESWPERYRIKPIDPEAFPEAVPQWEAAGIIDRVPGGIVLTADWLGRAAYEGRDSQFGNWIDPEERQRIYARDGYACRYCGSVENLSLDHVKPVSRGGGDQPSNLVTCCRSCNSRKHARTPEEAGMHLRLLARAEA